MSPNGIQRSTSPQGRTQTAHDTLQLSARQPEHSERFFFTVPCLSLVGYASGPLERWITARLVSPSNTSFQRLSDGGDGFVQGERFASGDGVRERGFPQRRAQPIHVANTQLALGRFQGTRHRIAVRDRGSV